MLIVVTMLLEHVSRCRRRRSRLLLLLLRLRLGWLNRAFEENANRAVFANPVRDLCRIDPHGELLWEQAAEQSRDEANTETCLGNHGIYLSIDANATVAAASVRLIGEPVIAVSVIQKLREWPLEHLQLPFWQLTRRCRLQAKQLDKKVGCWYNFRLHDCCWSMTDDKTTRCLLYHDRLVRGGSVDDTEDRRWSLWRRWSESLVFSSVYLLCSLLLIVKA